MNQLSFLVLYNHTKGVFHVPHFGSNAVECRLFAQSEYGFPDYFTKGEDEQPAFWEGEATYRYENAEGDAIEAVIYEVPGESVKNMLGDLVTTESAWTPV